MSSAMKRCASVVSISNDNKNTIIRTTHSSLSSSEKFKTRNDDGDGDGDGNENVISKYIFALL